MAKKPSTRIAAGTAARPTHPIAVTERDMFRRLAIDAICAAPFHTAYAHAPTDQTLRDAPHFAHHKAAIEALLMPLIDAMADQVCGMRPLPDIVTGQDIEAHIQPVQNAQDALHDYLQQHWGDLWQQTVPPFAASDITLYFEEQANSAIHHLIFPPYTIPLTTKLNMFDRAIRHTLNAPFNNAPFKNSALAQDGDLMEMMEEVFRNYSDERFRSSQDRSRMYPAPKIVYGKKDWATFENERDWHHNIRAAVSANKHNGTTHPFDAYDLFAALEARIGTEDAATLGAELCCRFIGSIDTAITRFESIHHLDKPYHYKGQTPQIA